MTAPGDEPKPDAGAAQPQAGESGKPAEAATLTGGSTTTPEPEPESEPGPAAKAEPPEWPILVAILLAVALSGTLLVLGVVQGQIRALPAALVLIFGTLTLFAGNQAVAGLARGETIEVSSHWGGLGGSLGGWRITPITTLLLLALVLVGATLAAGSADRPEENGTANANAQENVQENAADNSLEEAANAANAAANAAAENAVQNNVVANETGANEAAAEAGANVAQGAE